MNKASADALVVEVAIATPEAQCLIELRLPPGSRVADALAAARVEHPGAVGIFGRVVAPETPLATGDRVEVYRPLTADPKQARRRRVQRDRGEAKGRR
ncbi:MAG TPA: RnfH family protein [Nevskiaceae bacterium]|nr:RnfH family protein [Nevskiaceae bacterium]